MQPTEIHQDYIGQLPMLKTYLHFSQGFPIKDESHGDDLVVTICRAATVLVAAIPWLSAKVINQGRCEGNSGLFSIVPCPQFENTIVRRVKDCKSLCPPYSEILKSKACLKVLDGDVLAPRPAFPLSYQETDEDPAPVVALQVNLVQGGLLLNWACQHNVMDAAGLCQVMRLFSYVMRGESLPSSAIEWAFRSRKELIPLLSQDERQLEHNHLRRPAMPNPPISPSPFLGFKWCDFRFSAESLKSLKKLASNSKDFATRNSTTVSYVSTNDALTAFCWQRIASARIQLGRPADALCKLARAMDVRSIMKVSPEYMGHMIYISASFLPLEHIATRSVAHVASVMRHDLNDASSEHEIRSFATLIANTKDKSTIAFAGEFNPDLDVGSSSGLAMKHQFDYGPLGTPDFMNRPRFTPLPSTLYIMPMLSDGGVDVMLSLKPEELSIIKEDTVWNRYAQIHVQ
jgi:trichothecene 3-O-acetyltransferase